MKKVKKNSMFIRCTWSSFCWLTCSLWVARISITWSATLGKFSYTPFTSRTQGQLKFVEEMCLNIILPGPGLGSGTTQSGTGSHGFSGVDTQPTARLITHTLSGSQSII